MLDVFHKEPLALILTGVLLHPWSAARGSVLWSKGHHVVLKVLLLLAGGEKVHLCPQAERRRKWRCVPEM